MGEVYLLGAGAQAKLALFLVLLLRPLLLLPLQRDLIIHLPTDLADRKDARLADGFQPKLDLRFLDMQVVEFSHHSLD